MDRNCAYCFSTVFTLLLHQEVPSTCLPRDLPCLVFESSIRFWPIFDCKLVSNRDSSSWISTVLHIWLSFGIVHSSRVHCNILNDIKDHSTSARTCWIGTGGTGVTWTHNNEAHRGSDSVFYSLIWALRNEWRFLRRVSAHTPQLSLSPSHYFLSDLMENTTSTSLLGY